MDEREKKQLLNLQATLLRVKELVDGCLERYLKEIDVTKGTLSEPHAAECHDMPQEQDKAS
jgi:hypothetical protein